MLRAFKTYEHAHLVRLLATYRYRRRYYLLFPWADSNLRRYWESNPIPEFSRTTMMWLLMQCKAIASGLHIVHDFRSTQESDYAAQMEGTSSHDDERDDNVKQYGRHGDMKPENILWFLCEHGPDQGVLVIADFGLTDLHRRITRSGIPARAVTGSPTYEPPELRISATISREYDIWSLGCTFLEFLTWFVCGRDVLDRFAEARTMTTERNMWDDTFYTIESSRNRQTVTAVVRESVVQWMEDMRGLPRSSPFVLEFLEIISKKMLVVNPQDRIKARDLNKWMQKMLDKAETQPHYLMGQRARITHQQQHLDGQAPYSLRSSLLPILSRQDGIPLPQRSGNMAPHQEMRPTSPEILAQFYTDNPSRSSTIDEMAWLSSLPGG